jgi:3-oxoacyl-[acyl-carrier protein] reductase
MNLEGKTAVVVGASGGIGREISMALAEAGVNLVLVARRKAVLKALQNETKEKGVKVDLVTCDVTKKRSIGKLYSKIRKNHKVIDILFHLAGIGVYKKYEDIDFDEWERSLQINVSSVFHITQRVMPLLKGSEKAYVIASGSGMGKVALSGRSAYCASKFALRGLVLSLAKEYEGTNIYFIHLMLGSVLTAFGPLTKEEKLEKEKKGKKYIDPTWLARNVITRIENDSLEPETPIYPRHYFEESTKDKR